jgi:glycosyltransferase involved in cell wall biosynthesis
VELVTMRYGELPRLEVIGGVTVRRVPCVRFRVSVCSPPELLSYVLGAWPVVQRLVHESRPDIVHSHFILPDSVLAFALHAILAPAWKRVVRKASAIISPSQSLANLIRAQHYAGPLDIIPNGHHAEASSTTRHRPGNLLVVSRLFERKGVQYLLQALEDCARPINLHIVGDGPYVAALKQAARRLRTRAVVHFHGWLDNKSGKFRELFETSSIFALPSEAENFPISLLEAMAAGLAIITTSGTGCEEVVGPAALLVPPRDPARIRAAIEQLSADPASCHELGQTAHTRVHGIFSWRAIAEQHLETYERALHAARS